MHEVTLIPGDGIGPDIMEAAVKIVEATGVEIKWDEQLGGMAAVARYDTPIPFETLASIRKNRIAFKGPLTTPIGKGYRSVNVTLRQEFELYANVRPAKSMDGIKSRYKDVDLVVIRENTEGLYSGVEHEIKAEGKVIAAESNAIVTRHGAQRVVRFAFEFAKRFDHRKVSLIHKANIMKAASGLFLDVGREVAKEYPEIECDDVIIDACAAKLVMNPEVFDLLVTTNLFGDILSDLTSGLVGGLGVTPGANIGDSAAIFEAVHGSAPDIADKGIANPTAVIKGGIMMLQYLGEVVAAEQVDMALRAVIKEGKHVTADLNPSSKCSTAEMGQAIIDKMK